MIRTAGRASVEDAIGNSAIFEMIDGETKVYHDCQLVVMARQPSYNKQMQFGHNMLASAISSTWHA